MHVSHSRPRARNQTMGINPALIAAGVGAVKGYTGGGSTPPKTQPGGTAPGVGMPTTTISPAFQQSFTAQVSPVISPIIGSTGATTSGAPAQIAPGGQTAAGGGTGLPGMAPGISPLSSPFRDSFDVSRYAIPQQPAAQQAGINWMPWLIGGVLVLGVGSAIFFGTRPRKRGATRR